MIKSLKVTNHNGQSLTLDLYHPERSGLIISNIEGLGPPKADINSAEVAMIDGGLFTSARVTQRNIVITLAMMFVPLIEDSRLKTYTYFPIKKAVHLEFTTDYRIAECDGYVESNTPIIFTKQETTQISIICPDPFFYELGSEEEVFTGVMPLFEFPFSNESLSENLIEFGEVRQDTRANLFYRGDADTGIEIVVQALLGAAENITIWNVNTRENMRIDTNKIARLTDIQFDLGDEIYINTKIGSKSIQLLHDGKFYNIISCINKDADWFQITSGDNIFTFVAESGENNVMMTFKYRNAYFGM